MKKLIYILSLFALILLFDSCTKEDIFPCNGADHAEFDSSDEENRLGPVSNGYDGGVVDDDNDDDDEDEDDDEGGVVDDDNDDDDEDEDDDEGGVTPEENPADDANDEDGM